MSHLTLVVTETDIAVGRQCGVCPILCSIFRATDSLWDISEDGVGHQRRPPFATFTLTDAALDIWDRYLVAGVMAPCEITIELCDDMPSSLFVPAVVTGFETMPHPIYRHPGVDVVLN